MRDSGSGPARRTRSIPRATPRRARVARDGDGDDDGDDVGRLALSRAFGEGEEAEDWEARDGDDDRDGVRTRASALTLALDDALVARVVAARASAVDAGGDETPLERASSAAGAWVSERLRAWTPPKFLWRTTATSLLFGSVLFRLIRQPRRVNWEQTIQQIARVGPQTLGVSLLTSSFVGMVFTIQFCKEFAKVGLKNAIGGLLGLAFARELTPVICAIVLTGRIGSSIAAELGTMQVTEQVDQLTVLGTDPVDYLVIPRVIACAVSLPILSIISFAQSLGASILLADLRYGVSPNVILDSAAKYLEASDIGIMTAKSIAFGAVIAVISCGWGTTTTGGAKGVGESTTASVVISLTAIFIVDFVLSLVFFQK